MAKKSYIPRGLNGENAPKDEGGKSRDNDLGISTLVGKTRKRYINKDGTFNVIKNTSKVRELNIYQWLIWISWGRFLGVTLLFYFVINCLFAGFYLANGVDALAGASEDGMSDFWAAFFFSVQTLTTVGYGSVSPIGFVANLIAAMGALTGLMSFALITGLLFARFSKPSVSILFSENAVIAPYQNGKGLMFRLANERKNLLTNLNLEVFALWITIDENGKPQRAYSSLELERNYLSMLPLSWTAVHPISDKSPIFSCASAACEKMELEIIVIVEGYDDTFANIVRTHYSYKYDEIVWDAKFLPAYYINEEGNTVFELDKLNDFESID